MTKKIVVICISVVLLGAFVYLFSINRKFRQNPVLKNEIEKAHTTSKKQQTPEDVLEEAVEALDNNDIDGFVQHLFPYNQDSMKNKINQVPLPQKFIKDMSSDIKNATIVEQTDTYIKLETTINLLDGSSQKVNFSMVLKDGEWKIRGL